MPIKLQRVGDKYAAQVSPPDAGQDWATSTPLDFDELYKQLQDVGCQPIDVADAFIEADPSTKSRFGIND